MFKHFISLGWFCGTAAALSKHGLRNFSGPFDWYFSGFEGVIHILENDFEDFLLKDNLSVVEGKSKEFQDIKYDLRFIHDIKNCFEEEYKSIYMKYARRVRNFRSAIKEGVNFIRAVRDIDELHYIIKEESYINSVIKKYNKSNEIIYVITKDMHFPETFKGRFFHLKISSYYTDSMLDLRSLFDTNAELISFCIRNYNSAMRNTNLLFDLRKENDRLVENLKRAEKFEIRYQLLLKIINADYNNISLPRRIAIYGAGHHGKAFYDRVKDKCNVTCFIDSDQAASSYMDISIVQLQEYAVNEDTAIIVTPTYAFHEIFSMLKSIYHSDEVKIISVEDLL